MRVTAQTKAETQAAIVNAARKLFTNKGFQVATTRDLAAAASIASGTLFNYFPSKEALALTIVEQDLADLPDDAAAGDSLEEQLFSHVIAHLHRLHPLRAATGAIVESALSPFAVSNGSAADGIRTRHLETVRRLITDRARREPSTVAMHLYWTLFLGVLAFWSRDDSPHQQDTLAMLDQSMHLFVAALAGDVHAEEISHDA